MKSTRTGLGVALLAATSFAFQEVVEEESRIDPKLPEYVAGDGVAGNIKSVGSDTMNNLMALWSEGFAKSYPNVETEIEGKGSSTAPPALIEGSSTFGPMSRAMKAEELEKFKEAFGYEPVGLATSLDMLAVYVHKDNPIRSLSLRQIDAIFSKNREGGYEDDITTWGQLGLTGDWEDKPISIYGRNSASGTYGFFKKNALFKGDFKDSVKEQSGSAAVVSGIGNDKYAIGYSGIGYLTADVHTVALQAKSTRAAVPAEPEFAYDGTYPLARPLLLYVNYKPGAELEPLRAQFLHYVFSADGQKLVGKDGYLPITAVVAKRELAKVGLVLPEATPVEASAPLKSGR